MSGQRKAAGPRSPERQAPGKDRRRAGRRQDGLPQGVLKWAAASTGLVGTLLAAGRVRRSPTRAPTSPTPTRTSRPRPRYVYYADGKTVLGKFAEQNRDVDLARRDAAARPGRGRRRRGPHASGPTRASTPRASCGRPSTTPSGNATQGASTITQQYVKILYLTQERTWTRKAKEAILSLKIQRQLSKEEILEGYLNTIYFGRGAYGIQAAAQAYFDVDAKDLNLQQGAALAASSTPRTTSTRPTARRPGRRSRSATTTSSTGMADMGTIAADAGRPGARSGCRSSPKIAGREPVRRPARPRADDGPQRAAPARLQRRRRSTAAACGSPPRSPRRRWTPRPAGRARGSGPTASRRSCTSRSPRSTRAPARCAACTAGRTTSSRQINWAVAGGAPGSTFKPFALAAGAEDGFSLKDTFDGNSPLECRTAPSSQPGQRPTVATTTAPRSA